ncbi:hypothetical protein [Horticoccus sp. 23ND18S-11]|uniref:hypothetical protein n=1 Tax=Horticoccus sp. 23ND18S-11 TaxID=3391832 RepID=UPI0039C8C657
MKLTAPLIALVLAAFALAPAALAQRRPYIGYAYPAGGQQATTFQVKLGGQDLDDVHAVTITGAGVSARIVEYLRRLNNQEIQLLNEQLKELKRVNADAATGAASAEAVELRALQLKVERRTREWVQTPACVSIASVVLIEVTVSPEADAGARELRLVTARGVSNPLPFHVGQLREYARPPMATALLQVLGKEAAALRKRPATEAEVRIGLPCTLNGQIASGEENRYRFEATKGQRLVIATQARQLIPFVADAVPGWFQPVLVLKDATGREVAYADDFRFKPDPVILYEVPQDGDYVIAIRDGIYRGREDFVYRITVGELPYLTSLFPLGGQTASALPPSMSGWNLADAQLSAIAGEPAASASALGASRLGYQSNALPFAWGELPDATDREPNNAAVSAQAIALPVIINGRIDRPDDWDVYEFTGQAKQIVVAEVQARRLDSPLDAVIKLTDAAGKIVAFNDDREDLTAGLNTHAADSYLTARLPADGTYRIHIGDTARQGGSDYGYRLRVSGPQPDFELRVVPSSVSLAVNSSATVTIYAARKDGFNGPIKLMLAEPTAGLSAAPVTLSAGQTTTRLTLKGPSAATAQPVPVVIVGRAKIGERDVEHEAVPAEDRMQAFLWRHLVPALDLAVLVFDPKIQPAPKRVARPLPAPAAAKVNPPPVNRPKFTPQQITGRLRQLKLLYEEGLLTDAFYAEKVAECEPAS